MACHELPHSRFINRTAQPVLLRCLDPSCLAYSPSPIGSVLRACLLSPAVVTGPAQPPLQPLGPTGSLHGNLRCVLTETFFCIHRGFPGFKSCHVNVCCSSCVPTGGANMCLVKKYPFLFPKALTKGSENQRGKQVSREPKYMI